MGAKNLLSTTKGRFLTFGLLYISEGIPYGFTSTAMVAFMRTEGLSLSQIGTFVAALFLPWAFKWAWAPVIDLVKLGRFGGRKAWILFCTTMMMVTLLITATVDFVANFQLLLIMIVLNNFFCATQDVAIDSLAVSTLKEDERGRGNGFMFGGQYLGIALGGGGAVFIFGFWGFNVTLFYISGMLLLSWLFVLFFVHDPDVARQARQLKGNALLEFSKNLVSFLRILYASFLKSGAGPKLGLIFSLLPVGAMALQYAILGTIKVDYGLTATQIAQISIASTVFSALGCLIGGVLGDRFGLKKIIGIFYFLTVMPTLLLATQISTLGLQNVPLHVFYGVIVSHGLLFGMSFGVKNAVFMGMTNPAVAATQFTAFMAMSNLAISFANFWQGNVAEQFNYATVLYLDALLVIFPLLVIPFLRNREDMIEASLT
ncbi:MAG: MFS transporter [Gammaproteobacteria bacterium]|nr:MFS transporter [Gammaproteobacteria bacterium]MDH3432314.1 MFS transporter [Gammaproteobacteria bacterium]